MTTRIPRAAPHREGELYEERQLTIRNDLEELARVYEFANEILERHGAEEKIVYATHLALEEVLSNVIRHGYQDGNRHEIEVTLRMARGVVELLIVDDGREFDPVQAPDPRIDVPLAQRQEGGLGIHLLRAFVSEMRYERLGDRNSLWIRI